MKTKQSNGITLIALVITIIVLLILAGVAIAMLSGENGILKKAAEAKTKTEEAQKEEDATLIDMEMTTNFLTNNSKYKCRYGFITGIEVNDTIEDLENVLPDGYKVALKYKWDSSTENGEDNKIEESEKNTTKISTGMAIVKDGKIVARTVLFGDVNCDGKVNAVDRGILYNYMKFGYNFMDFQKLAANVYDDNEINNKDINLLNSYIHSSDSVEINQSRDIKILPKNIRRWNTKIQGYINSLNRDSGYEFEYNEETDTYKIKGISKNKTAGVLINELPNSSELKVFDEVRTEITEDAVVSTGYYIEWTSKDEDNNDVIIRWSIETK